MPINSTATTFLILVCVAVFAAFTGAVRAQDKPQATDKAAEESAEKPLPTIAKKTEDAQRLDGLMTMFVDHRAGRVWLKVGPPAGDRRECGRFLYVEGLTAGLGSNPVGLDRSQMGRTRLVVFRRVGGRVLIEQPNLSFRALSDDAAERRAVRESFATSILWAGKAVARDPDDSVLVDFTSFLVRDAHNVAATLERTGQGTFSLDKDRSVLDTRACLAFPDNLEFEALLTYASKKPGAQVRATAPDGRSVTLVQHHSLVRLPAPGYRPRRFDPRTSSNAIRFMNYAAPLSEPLETRWIARHRLEKTDPTAARSLVKEPIVYYVDPGAPEPVRSALIEGASWWAQAFEAAGFVDAFRVETLPAGAHPLDVRYNVIQWVHRSARGWSYGGSVSDPRTGEIIKGHVLLGSLRIRQDRLLFEGLVGTEGTGRGGPNDPIEAALARIRQLSAHEVGHTLGFAHNFAASTYGGRASVMDYPAPLIRITADGRLDLSDAYAVGIGTWDKHALRYAYSEFPPDADESAELERIAAAGPRDGLLFITDADARPLGGAHPSAHLWDNGDDAAAALQHALRVRAIALAGFGARNIAAGRPLSKLHEVLVPVYLHHRYQLEAAIKLVGGVQYEYAVRGDRQPPARPVAGEAQRRALSVILSCLTPKFLDLPDGALDLLLPRPHGHSRNREMFGSSTGPAFDALGAAATAADSAVTGLVHPQRCARLIDQHRRDPSLPGLTDVIDALVDKAFPKAVAKTLRDAEIQRTVQTVVVRRLIGLAASAGATPAVRARADYALASLRARVAQLGGFGSSWQPHARMLHAEIDRHLNRPHAPATPAPTPVAAPPGMPIGTGPPDLGGCSFER